MKIKNIVLSCAAFMLFSIGATAQINILNAKSPQEIGVKKVTKNDEGPISYGYVDERDILWSKSTWERIDLNERMNFPLYFPIDTNNIGREYRSLYDVLVKGIRSGEITHVYSDSYFNQKRDLADISASLVYRDTTDMGVSQFNAGEQVDPQYIRSFSLDAGDIEEWRVRGYWYIDKRQGELKYRLIGIAPVANEARSKAFPDDMDSKVELFWIFYPDARKTLHKAYTFNSSNSAQPVSFDHLLNSRRFSGVIYKEDNEYGDRSIKDYIAENALMQLLESERIKDKIRNIEMDLWVD